MQLLAIKFDSPGHLLKKAIVKRKPRNAVEDLSNMYTEIVLLSLLAATEFASRFLQAMLSILGG